MEEPKVPHGPLVPRVEEPWVRGSVMTLKIDKKLMTVLCKWCVSITY